MFAGIKSRVPWWGKIGAKLVLARMPMAYGLWQKMGLFRHGYMDTASYALNVFNAHAERAGLDGDSLRGKVVLEIGPGDSIATAVIAHAYGARAVLVDAGRFAREDMAPYLALCDLLRQRGLTPPNLLQIEGGGVNEVIEASGGRYLTSGLTSWKEISGSSVDLIFSQAVLEHVRRDEFLDMQWECLRVLRPGATTSHRVDLRDHLGGSLNNLRFSEKVWESDFFASSGFYTNRIRYREMINLFDEAGFSVEPGELRCWPQLPIPRKKLDVKFSELTDADLCVAGFDVLLRRPLFSE